MLKRAEDLRVLVRSYAEHLPPQAALSHRSALIVHGLSIPYFHVRGDNFAEAVHPSRASRREKFVLRYREIPENEFENIDGIRTTSVHRTLLDISRDYPLAFAVPVVDEALRRELVTEVSFRAYCAENPVRTGRKRIGAVLDHMDKRRETVAESICAVRFIEHSIPGFEPQVVISDETGAFVARTDFANERAKVIVEFDGAGKYHLAGIDPKEAFELERRREYQLRNLGYIVFRVRWQDLFTADIFLRIKSEVVQRLAAFA